MLIVSINIALPAGYDYGDKQIVTGGDKQPVAAAMLRLRGFEGDGQADLENHGSPDQAVLAFDADHYPDWEARLGRPLAPGAFSENLTVTGAAETALCVGDIVQTGDVIMQVTQPRQPCYKLAHKLGEPRLVDWIIAAGQGGVYFRVLAEGRVAAGATLAVTTRHPDRISIATINDLIYNRVQDWALVEHLATMPELSADNRRRFVRKMTQRA
jgi:MOSC domain-containing protein YiiM